MKIQPLIAVADVAKSSQWYQKLLACKSGHGGSEYEQLVKDGDEDFFMQLHAWDAHEHENLRDPKAHAHGYGVLLWFLVDDFNAVVRRAQAMKVEIVKTVHVNELANHREYWLRDLDGYVVVLASRYGDLA